MSKDKYQISRDIREIFEWDKWMYKIPMLEIPRGMVVKAVPPFSGAIIRYWFASKKQPEKFVSVYLDGYNQLGYHGGAYWEIYPAADGDTMRFNIDDTKTMMKEIKKAIKKL